MCARSNCGLGDECGDVPTVVASVVVSLETKRRVTEYGIHVLLVKDFVAALWGEA